MKRTGVGVGLRWEHKGRNESRGKAPRHGNLAAAPAEQRFTQYREKHFRGAGEALVKPRTSDPSGCPHYP